MHQDINSQAIYRSAGLYQGKYGFICLGAYDTTIIIGECW